MNVISSIPRKTILYGAALAATALVIALLAASYAASPARAQTPGNTDPDPQPCGPYADTAFMKEPHEVTSGHFALFEAYWRWTGLGDDAEDTGVLHTNLCPPLVTTTREDNFGIITETTTRSARKGGMDVEEAIMHVKDKHKADVVADNAAAGQLSLKEYPAVRKALGLGEGDHVATGTQVWWLKLDDPRTTGVDEKTPDMSLGFSTLLLNDKHWLTRAEGNPMRYKFLVERYPAGPGSPEEVPHFFAYEAPDVRAESSEDEDEGVKLVWDSTKPAVEQTDVLMDPGEFHALQWVFTKPGTYLLWVELQGYVRKDNPYRPMDAEYEDWKPVGAGKTETSEVYRYTIQVGETLDELEPPIFGVNLKVGENTPGGIKVDDPIPVYNAEADVLYYRLVDRETREESDEFELAKSTSTAPHTVQVVVKDGASLDYETTPSYELELSVADKLDHESNERSEELSYPDDILIVRIDLEDQEPGVVLDVDRGVVLVGETVNLFARYEPAPEHLGRTFAYEWAEMEQTKTHGIKWHAISTAPNAPAWSVSQSSAMEKTYRVAVALQGTDLFRVHSNDIEIFWVD